MKKLLLSTLIFLIPFTVLSQSCLPEGITFTTQTQIDSFQIVNPGCTEIEGDVSIQGGNNLNGLGVITSIWGKLYIETGSLTNLNGLNNLTSVGGHLNFGKWGRNAFPNQPIECYGNFTLSNITALTKLTSVGGNLGFYCNDSLSSLTGLENLTVIGGSLNIGYAIDKEFFCETAGNQSLVSLTGLEGLTSVGGNINIQGNRSLKSLSGLNIGILINGGLTIRYNDSLAICEEQSICDYLSSPNGAVQIHNNAIGCNSPIEVANVCSITLPCLPYGNYYLLNQSEIDNFQSNYHNCTEIEGNVYISGDDITNLAGLGVLTSIGGYLNIGWSECLNLNNMYDNPLLNSLIGLEGLTSVGGISIRLNDTLSTLTGLDNIDATSITDLTIWANRNLSTCEVKSICDYLAAPNGEINLHSNAPGCDSQEEVLDSCDFSSITNFNLVQITSANPNPFNTSITVSYELQQPEKVSLNIYNQMGKQVYQKQENQLQGKQQLIWNAENFADGIYYYRLQVGEQVTNGKMVKVR